MVTRAEKAGEYVTTVQSTQVLTFDSYSGARAPGNVIPNITWANGATTIGTIDSVNVFLTDVWGGAGDSGSNYAAQKGTATTTLTLSIPNAYFGLWWSAGDPYNQLTFFHGTTQIASFDTKKLLDDLPTAYKGNPRISGNPNQGYAFLNFYGLEGTTWDKVVFTNTSSASNFESDNWTTRVQAWGQLLGEGPTPPGVLVKEIITPTVIPEPSSLLAAMTSLTCLLLRRRR
jgi:hypothetical protein